MIIAVAVIIVIWKQMPTNVMSINMEFKIRKFPSEYGNAESIYWEAEHGSEFEISIWYICMSYMYNSHFAARCLLNCTDLLI